jgi:hypothetical protein
LNISPTATLDLTNNDLVLDYTGDSPAAAIEALVAKGYNGGDWLGGGITSGVAAAQADDFVLAVADNEALDTPFDFFDGVDVDDTTVLIKFTHRLDLNLDGVVNGTDAAIFGTHFSPGEAATFAQGDVNFNGVFDGTDAAIFGTSYDPSGSQHLPEPAAAAGALLAAASLLARRRRLPKTHQ